MIRYLRFATPLGTMLALAEDELLTAVDFEDARYAPARDAAWRDGSDVAVLRACERELAEYFAGQRARFTLPLAPRGTPFQRRVWQEIAAIPFGATRTYSELAARCASPAAVRAAGAATGRNPFAIVVPCHRVVGRDGSLTGYAGGLERKARLLALERAGERALP